MWAELYPWVAEEVLSHPLIHGSTVRDLFCAYAKGRFAVDNHAEMLLTELVEQGLLTVGGLAPTASQGAFLGLSRRKGHPGWVPGCREHYWYRRAS